jgi:hypothetical protein
LGDCPQRFTALVELEYPGHRFLFLAFSTSLPQEPKSQPKGAWPLMRSFLPRFTFIAARVRSRISSTAQVAILSIPSNKSLNLYNVTTMPFHTKESFP